MDITRIEPEVAAERAESGETILDVRSVREFGDGHAEGAINIPLMDHGPGGRMAPNPRFMEVVSARLAKDTPLITMCAKGGRSLKAAQLLASAGYGQVVDMAGGMLGAPGVPGWAQSGLPVVDDGESYASVLASIDS